MITIDNAVEIIINKRRLISDKQAMLVAISGIDGSGKGYLAGKIATLLSQQNLQVVNINIDGWLNLPEKRFSETNSSEHFYHHAIRFDELFAQLVFPLRDYRSVCVEVNYVEETATAYRKQTYNFEKVDVILLEGIYLLKRQFHLYYDLSLWIECSFETALERAVARSQEALPPDETVGVYQTIYFPAQEIHFILDQPKLAATATINNDPRLNV